VIVERAEIEPLTDYIWLGAYPDHDSRLLRVARLFKSLATGLRNLDEFYRKLKVFDSGSPLGARLFPRVCSYTAAEEVRFYYISKLAARNPEKAIFKAKERDGRDIVVKFAHRYNADAHRVLAREGLAPALFYVGDTYPTMVVMEYLQGSSAEQMYYKAPPPPFVYKDVQAAISALHRSGLVFGDLRRPNIMIWKKKAKLVDFDWCGQDGQDRYPGTLNTTICWHEGVDRGVLMCKDHDLFMLKMLQPSTLYTIFNQKLRLRRA
jgi:hypothetical protein